MTETTKNQPAKTIRCAVYTRKSTSEGLDQDFTSLDAQREAAESYIASQKHEGWVALPTRYDDGGFTGANTDRPALQKLMTDIKDGKIDCVVVYKVDRLSRSLIDFVQLLELFEQHHVTFVSVTQHFNTNTSMGRLTLNILLSFAQFEREIISERTRDKMAAARKKGKWVGGRVVLGYDLDREHHKLVVNPQEAELVREIFTLYLRERSAMKVITILNERGVQMKRYVTQSGKAVGGGEFRKSHVYTLISNPIYLGKIPYHGQLYPGLHEPILIEEIFERAQEVSAENRRRPLGQKGAQHVGLLSQLLRCRACRRVMINTYTYDSAQKQRKYKYYVCTNAQKLGYQACPTRSVNAEAIDQAVISCLRTLARNSDGQRQQIEQFRSHLQAELARLAEDQRQADASVHELTAKLSALKAQHSADPKVRQDLERLKEQLQDAERKSSELRIKRMDLEEQLLSQGELSDALLVTSPVWDTLFIQEKRRILRLLLKEVDYDARDGKLGLTLSGKGIRLLSSELNPPRMEVTHG